MITFLPERKALLEKRTNFERMLSQVNLFEELPKVGAIMSDVPGGSASRPSSVIQINRFCLECGTSEGLFVRFPSSFEFGILGWKVLGASEAIARVISRSRMRHQKLMGIIAVEKKKTNYFVETNCNVESGTWPPNFETSWLMAHRVLLFIQTRHT